MKNTDWQWTQFCHCSYARNKVYAHTELCEFFLSHSFIHIYLGNDLVFLIFRWKFIRPVTISAFVSAK